MCSTTSSVSTISLSCPLRDCLAPHAALRRPVGTSTMAEWRMADGASFRLADYPVHLGLGARVLPQAQFTGEPAWYESYAERNAADGAEGRLVTVHTFTEPWDSWEVHPSGEELVLCTEGTITLHQEIDGVVRTATINSGEAII